jgi:hypothetical protein
MTAVGAVFLLLGISLSIVQSTSRRSWLPTWLFGYHTGFAISYWLYSLSYNADSVAYYNGTRNFAELTPGTPFISWLTVFLRDTTGGSYFDLFMMFHLPGYLGLVKLFDMLRPFGEQSARLGRLATLVLFLPGLHFWTCAIGKDSLTFLGIVTFLASVHAANRLSLGAISGLAVCALARPHIALLLGASWGLALLFASRVNILVRVATLVALGAAVALAAPWVAEYVGLEGLDADAMDGYVESRQEMYAGKGSSVDMVDYPFPLQVFTFMFRPLFFDANGLLGIVVSAENALYLGLALWTMPRTFMTVWGGGATAFMRMNLVFWGAGVSVLGATISNLGLAIRQKTMVLPSFLLVVMTSLVIARRVKVRTEQVVQPSNSRVGVGAQPRLLPQKFR